MLFFEDFGVNPTSICCIPALDCRWYQRKFLGVFDLSIDPVNEVAGLGVDSRVLSHGTTVTPGDNSTVDAITGHRTTRVSLKSKLRSQNNRLKVNPHQNKVSKITLENRKLKILMTSKTRPAWAGFRYCGTRHPCQNLG